MNKMPSLKEMREACDRAKLAAAAGNDYAAGVSHALSWALGDTETRPGQMSIERINEAATGLRLKP